MDEKVIPDDIEKLLTASDEIIREDNTNRLEYIREIKRRELYVQDHQFVLWDESAADFISDSSELSERTGLDASLFNRHYNIYKGYLESIVAALSVATPAIQFLPQDGDNPDDIRAARARSRAAHIIIKRNKADILLMRALYILYNQNFVASYVYTDQNSKYGKYRKPKFKTEKFPKSTSRCPHCGDPYSESEIQPGSDLENKVYQCDKCGNLGQPIEEVVEEERQVEDGYDEEDKSKVCIQVFGPAHVKIPTYATCREECPYLEYAFEQHEAIVKETYQTTDIGAEQDDPTENRARINQWDLDNPRLVTVRKRWLRPSVFWQLDEDTREQYLADYPNGILLHIVNDKVLKVEASNLDDYWAISQNPMSLHLHANPIGASLVPIQDMTNDLMNLTLQTIEYGIPDSYADPEVLDFKAYQSTVKKPGQIFPAKPLAGQRIGDAFHSEKPASLSREVEFFANRLEGAGQFVTGAYPSIYGGQNDSGSKTFSEYSMSRQQALQRLSIVWKFLSYWWADTFKNATDQYRDMLEWEDKLTEEQNGVYQTTKVSPHELQGEIGEVFPESSEQFPISWAQQKDLIIQLMGMNSEEINTALFSPQNSGILARALGFRDFIIPYEADRYKQLQEIQEILRGEPVQIDPEIDNHAIEFEVCKTWLTSDPGQTMKRENPNLYFAVQNHALEHKQSMMMQQQPPMENPNAVR